MRRTEILQVRVTPQEKAKIREMAKASGHSDSEFCRWRILRNTRIRKGDERPELTREPEEPRQPGESLADYAFRLRWSAMTDQEKREFQETCDRVDEGVTQPKDFSREGDAAQVIRFSRETDKALKQAETAAVQLPNGMMF